MKLNDKYRLSYDDNNVVLEFFEKRLVKTGKNIGKEYEHVEPFYYPNIKTALNSFLQKSLKGSGSVEEVLKRISDVEKIINKI